MHSEHYLPLFQHASHLPKILRSDRIWIWKVGPKWQLIEAHGLINAVFGVWKGFQKGSIGHAVDMNVSLLFANAGRVSVARG